MTSSQPTGNREEGWGRDVRAVNRNFRKHFTDKEILIFQINCTDVQLISILFPTIPVLYCKTETQPRTKPTCYCLKLSYWEGRGDFESYLDNLLILFLNFRFTIRPL